MADKENVREQFTEAFEGADYPVNSPMDLVPALPNGPATSFQVGDEEITAMELNQKASGEADYPYDSVDELVDDLVEGMDDRGYF
ncbi:MTH865 family protein [Halorarius halobius]|uniref:MTH865 family protein n=1 Tax=Halorarius halobius TaxID=2962671 RepID=UPI0020CCDFC8|nr:MTH865 family protein [Halorarius halobius]